MEPLKKGSINQKFLNRKILGRKNNQKSNINNIVSFELNADRSDSFLNSSQRMNVTRWWYLIARGVFSVDSGQLPAPLLPHQDGSPDKPAEKNRNSKVQLSWLVIVSKIARPTFSIVKIRHYSQSKLLSYNAQCTVGTKLTGRFREAALVGGGRGVIWHRSSLNSRTQL